MGVLFQTEGPTTEKALFRHVLTNCSHLAVSLSKWAYYLSLLSVTILTQKGPFLLSKQSTVDNKQDSRPL